MFLLLRLAPLAGGDVERLAALPHWWNLYCYHHLVVQENREKAQRAAEREELVYGLAIAVHDPKGLPEWKRTLRDNAGLLQSPSSAKERAMEMVEKLKGVVWVPIDQLAPHPSE